GDDGIQTGFVESAAEDAGFAEHRPGQIVDLAGFLEELEECARRRYAVLGMSPSRKCFCTHHAAGCKLYLRLKERFELILLQPANDLGQRERWQRSGLWLGLRCVLAVQCRFERFSRYRFTDNGKEIDAISLGGRF